MTIAYRAALLGAVALAGTALASRQANACDIPGWDREIAITEPATLDELKNAAFGKNGVTNVNAFIALEEGRIACIAVSGTLPTGETVSYDTGYQGNGNQRAVLFRDGEIVRVNTVKHSTDFLQTKHGTLLVPIEEASRVASIAGAWHTVEFGDLTFVPKRVEVGEIGARALVNANARRAGFAFRLPAFAKN